MKSSPGFSQRPRRPFRLAALSGHLLAGALALSAPAVHADVIDFEQIVNESSQGDGTIYNGQDAFTTGAWHAVVSDSAYVQSFPDYEPGLAGATVGAGESSACLYLACPWPISRYYAGLNDGALTLSRQDGNAFTLSSLRYGGIATEADEGGSGPFGRLRLAGTTADGSVVTAWADFPVLHLWADWQLDASFAGVAFTSLTIDACAYAASGACINGGALLNASQFAIDDLRVSAVPEPAAWLLLAGGLPLLALRRRMGGRP